MRFSHFHIHVALYLSLAGSVSADSSLNITPATRAWLDELGPIRFSYDPEFAPFESTDSQKEYVGVAADFLALVSESLGVELELVRHASWGESVEAIRQGDIDLLPCVGINEERSEFLAFSEPYLQFARVVVTRRDFDYFGLSSLPEERIAVQRASSHHGYINATTDMDPVLFNSFREAMLAVAAGDIDALVGNLATVTYMIRNLSLNNLEIAGRLGEDTFTLHMAVRKDLAQLIPLLNQALNAISLRKRTQILDHWVPIPEAPDPEVELTRAEREWLLANPRIRLGWDPAWAPVEFANDDGHPRGLSVDFIKELESRLGIRFDYEPRRPWPETIERLKERRIDMVSCVGFVEGRESFMTLTDGYLSAPVVLFTRSQYPYVRNLGEMNGKTVAVPVDYAVAKWMERDHPRIIQLPVESVEAGLRAVREGKAEAFVGSVMQGNYYLSTMRNWELNIAGETEYENLLQMGVRSDWPTLVNILNKTVSSIPESKSTEFYRKWVLLEYRHGFDYRLAFRVALIGAAAILLFVLWNRRLAREVRLRTKAENEVQKNRADLEKSFLHLKQVERQKENLTHMIVHDMRSPLTIMSGALDLAQKELRDGQKSPHATPETIEMAQSAVKDISHIVDSLLDVGRLEEGKMPILRQSGSLRDTATAAADALDQVARRNGVNITVAGSEGVCSFDHHLIRRVFDNLISNAIKACSSGDRIAITIEARANGFRVTVQDTGAGIPEEHHSHIFEKFSQVEKRWGKPYTASSGVGLSFCRLAVEAHGGKIGLHSRVGEGSRFWFDLPS